MIVRIRLGTGRPIQRKRGEEQAALVLACGALLIPASRLACTCSASGGWHASTWGLPPSPASPAFFRTGRCGSPRPCSCMRPLPC